MPDDTPTSSELLTHVPESLHARFKEAVSLIDSFCAEHLNEQYKTLCRAMTVSVFQNIESVHRGKVVGWAAGIVYAVGWVNFLTDPSQEPHMRREDIAKGFGISRATMDNRFRDIREGMEIVPFDPAFTLPDRMDDNPLTWMLEVDGFIVDVRMLPYEIQKQAFNQGLIPYIPEDQTREDVSKKDPMLPDTDNRTVIVPGQRIELKLSKDERHLILKLAYLEGEIQEQIRRVSHDQSDVPLTLDELDLLAGSVAAEANHTDNGRRQRQLDRIYDRIERLLDTYTDEPRLV